MRRFTLGSYPEIGLSEARKAARALHHRVKFEEADPVRDRRRQRALAGRPEAETGTLAALLSHYEMRAGKDLKSWLDGRRRIESVFRPLLKLPLQSVQVSDLQIAADKHAAVSSASAAVRYLRPILK
jgi:hypothetical protein